MPNDHSNAYNSKMVAERWHGQYALLVNITLVELKAEKQLVLERLEKYLKSLIKTGSVIQRHLLSKK